MTTLNDYLDYNPPRLVAAQKHTGHKTTYPANPRIDDVHLTTWTSFAEQANIYAASLRERLRDNHIAWPPLPNNQQIVLLKAESQVNLLMGEFLNIPLKAISQVVFGKMYSVDVVSGLTSLDTDAGIVSVPTEDLMQEVAYCAIEYKTIYAFPSVEDGDLVAAYNKERSNQQSTSHVQTRKSVQQLENQAAMTNLNHSDQTKVSRAIAQIWAYMTVNHLRYGILTTFNDTYFFRRSDHEKGTPSQLQVSNCCSIGDGNLSFMTAWLYMTSLAVESHLYSSPYTTPQMSRKVMRVEDPYQLQIYKLSEIYFLQLDLEPKSKLSFANIGSLEQPLYVYVKFFDISKNEDAFKKFKLEQDAYKQLENLQGSVIPKLYGSFLASGFLYGLFLEQCGQEVTKQVFQAESSRIIKLLQTIHQLGVAHGDVAERNVVIKDDQIRLIDFDNCKLRKDFTENEWADLTDDDFQTFK